MGIIQSIILLATSLAMLILPIPQFVEGVTGQPQTFLPTQATTATDKTVSKLIFRGLFKYDNFGTLVPDLADTWTVSEGGITYTIKLKDNQHWSNGRKITADDVMYTAFNTQILSDVATDKIDDLTIRLTLPNRFSPFLDLLTIGIVPQNSLERGNLITPVCSGPFRVSRIHKNGEVVHKIILTQMNPQKDVNDDEITTTSELSEQSNLPTHKIKKLIFHYYPNEEELIIAAKLGEIDGFLSSKPLIDPKDIATRIPKKLENFKEHKFPIQGVYYALFFNLRDEKFGDVGFRQKLEWVLPLDSLTFDYGIRTQGAVSRSYYTDEEIEFDKYDKTFEENFGGMEVSITIPKAGRHNELAERIKDVWEDKLNLDVKIVKVEAEEIGGKVIEPRNFEILLYGQEVSRDPDRYVNWHSTQGVYPGLNLSGFEHVRSDRALEEGRKEQDFIERGVHYEEFQKVMDEQVPAIFLYHPHAFYYVSGHIEGVGEKYTFDLTDRFLDLGNWKRLRTN